MPSLNTAGTALFLKRWLRRPFAMGAVVPSGRLLAEAMARADQAVVDGRPRPCRRAGRRHRRGHQGAAGRRHRAGAAGAGRARSRAGGLPAPAFSRTAHHRGRRRAPAAAARPTTASRRSPPSCRACRCCRCRPRIVNGIVRRRVRGAAARRAPWCSSPTGRRRRCRARCASACAWTARTASASGATCRPPWSGPSEGLPPRDLLPLRRRAARSHRRPPRPLRAAPPRRSRRPDARRGGGGRGRSRRAGRGGASC